ncbi:alpha/beta hydrolase [Streptomyces sp. NBC_00249]|uniref:alpha/beta hydrolase n=1 Tax=Streptomyces sp. NBC_00249 TaxID=2975690 RepID=UPI0022552F01|nr:alpha/beta hydrolase [Streptomyces sp. NBC_00249]MCX5199818.1 alpha/beta hydrolase [Streptomyces sp. NBC_00249]
MAALALTASVTTLAVPVPSQADASSSAELARTAHPASPHSEPLTWTACGDESHPRLQCASLKVPLDHDRPRGREITLALNRTPHTSSTFQGPLLVNGGFGSGLSLARFVASALPEDVASQYDVVGFDMRGIGSSDPALDCKPGYFDPVRPDSVPHSVEEERANIERAHSFAKACGSKYADVLPYINTISIAKDMDVIRAALGAKKINYLGYSYGTYLGAVYARLFPERVRRLALDSIVGPTAVWHDHNIAQDYAFDARHKAFAAWVARHDDVYHLGTDPAEVEALWYQMREDMRSAPAGGKVGPQELEDTYLAGGYNNGVWPSMADAFAAYVNDRDTTGLADLYEELGAIDSAGDNIYSVYSAVQCRDARWPRDWRTWHRETSEVHAKAPFLAWNNAWYNAPCAFWPVKSLKPLNVANAKIPPALLIQATDDAATPYEGALEMHRLLPASRLVVEEHGGNHIVSLRPGNPCIDEYLARYLAAGALPRGGPGPDATCQALPDPEPTDTPDATDLTTGPDAGVRAGLGRR